MLRKLFQSIRLKISEYKKNNSIPGCYTLFEYYTDKGKNLVNVKENEIISEKIFWEICFYEDGKYTNKSNLNIPLVVNIESGTWSKAKNFVTLNHPDDFRKSVEFQFAFEEGNLKLLKKDEFGNIIVFAFLRRVS
jgi:hypothetical protein